MSPSARAAAGNPIAASQAAAEPDQRIGELDARLAVGAATAWLMLLVALNCSVLTVVQAAVAAGCVGLTGVVLALRWHHDADDADAVSLSRATVGAVASTVAMGALCCVIVLVALAADLTRIEKGPVHDAAVHQRQGSFEATVSADPRAVGSGSFGGAPVIVDAQLHRLRSSRSAYRVNVAVVVLAGGPGWSQLQPGQRIRFDGRASPPDGATLTAATIHARGAAVPIGRPSTLQRLATTVRASLRRACHGLPEPERGLLPGLVDGDTAGLDPALKQQFRVAGLTHLVAVSGTNAAIVIGVVLLVLRRLRVPPWLAAAVAALCLVLFVAVARPSPSVLRAAAMASVLLVSLATGRPRQGLPALSFAVLLLLAWHPDWARNAGFAMSALATGALLVLAPGWARALRERHVPAGIAEGLAVAAAATAVSAPVIVLLSGQVSLVSLPANLLAEVAVAPATVLGVLAAATAPWSPPLGSAFAYAASWPCRWLVEVATFFGTLPGATVAWPGTVAGASALLVMTTVVIALVRNRRWRALVVAAALTALVLQIPVRSVTGGWPARGAIFVVCTIFPIEWFVLRMAVLPLGGQRW